MVHGGKRLGQIRLSGPFVLQKKIGDFPPDRVAVEKFFFYRMSNTILVAQARGVILLALHQQHLEPTEFTPAQVKQALTGYGNAEKIAVQEAVARELNLAQIPRPDDAADALALALADRYSREPGKTP